MLSGLNSALGLRKHSLVDLYGITTLLNLDNQFLGQTAECISPLIYPVIFLDHEIGESASGRKVYCNLLVLVIGISA